MILKWRTNDGEKDDLFETCKITTRKHPLLTRRRMKTRDPAVHRTISPPLKKSVILFHFSLALGEFNCFCPHRTRRSSDSYRWWLELMVSLFDMFVPLCVDHEIEAEINSATIKRLNWMSPYEWKQHVVKHYEQTKIYNRSAFLLSIPALTNEDVWR